MSKGKTLSVHVLFYILESGDAYGNRMGLV